MSLHSSRHSNNRKNSIYREVGSGIFIGIRTINEIEDVVDTSEAYMTDPTVVFNGDGNKVIFYYNTKDPDEIEELETLFLRTVKRGSTITLSDAFYLNELSGDDATYDLSGTYKFESYDKNTKTVIASPISVTKKSNTTTRYDSRFWLGSLLWTTSDAIVTREVSYEIINFVGPNAEHSFTKTLGVIEKNDRIEIDGIGTFTVESFRVDTDENWERIKVREEIPEKDLLGEQTYIRLLGNGTREQASSSLSGGVITTTAPKPLPGPDDIPPSDLPEQIPVDAPIGQWHIDWFLWFLNTGVPYANQVNEEEPIQSLDWRRLGFPQYVQTAWEILVAELGYSWDINTLNFILANWGSGGVGGVAGGYSSGNIPTGASLTSEIALQRTNKSAAQEKWLRSGSKKLTIRVTPTPNGNAFITNNGSPRETLELDEGITVQVFQTDKSNGISGFSMDTHPFTFSRTPDGTWGGGSALSVEYSSRKTQGTRGSYFYFTVPFGIDKIYYYCTNHENMGGTINIKQQETQSSTDDEIVIDTGTLPSSGYGSVSGINSCCDCPECLLNGLYEVESGDWRNPGGSSTMKHCNACLFGWLSPSGDCTAGGCGPYQLFPDFVTDARQLCPTKGIHGPGLPRIQSCCDIPADAHTILCKKCTTQACCAEKKKLSELIIACWQRRYTRNQGKTTSSSCNKITCGGHGDTIVDGHKCYTCEDLAKMHKEGRCGHKCCTSPGCCDKSTNPAEGGDACNRADQYWDRVKSVMCSNPSCSGCDDCGGTDVPDTVEEKS